MIDVDADATVLVYLWVLCCHALAVCVYNCSPEMVPTVLDDDKMNIDDEAVMKLLEKFWKTQNDQQVVKNCDTEPQVMAPVTGELLELSLFCLWLNRFSQPSWPTYQAP